MIAVPIDDEGTRVTARSPTLRAGAAVLGMMAIRDALRHRRPELIDAKVSEGRRLLRFAGMTNTGPVYPWT